MLCDYQLNWMPAIGFIFGFKKVLDWYSSFDIRTSARIVTQWTNAVILRDLIAVWNVGSLKLLSLTSVICNPIFCDNLAWGESLRDLMKAKQDAIVEYENTSNQINCCRKDDEHDGCNKISLLKCHLSTVMELESRRRRIECWINFYLNGNMRCYNEYSIRLGKLLV